MGYRQPPPTPKPQRPKLTWKCPKCGEITREEAYWTGNFCWCSELFNRKISLESITR